MKNSTDQGKELKLSNFPPKPKTIEKKLEYIQKNSEKQKV